ncbi:MAG: nucleotidyltransferase domain-containing protein [Gammaproteobacteria bacterium]|nr:nucleotidyltransferase domain-containing protein [Gammaproteobacteria bacterium]
MNADINSLLKELKTGLRSIYGNRLHGVYLYGSCARAEAGHESDVDVLVVLGHIPSYSAEVDRTSALIASLSLKHSVCVSRVFVSLSDWRQGQTPFLLNAREEAVAA